MKANKKLQGLVAGPQSPVCPAESAVLVGGELSTGRRVERVAAGVVARPVCVSGRATRLFGVRITQLKCVSTCWEPRAVPHTLGSIASHPRPAFSTRRARRACLHTLGLPPSCVSPCKGPNLMKPQCRHL